MDVVALDDEEPVEVDVSTLTRLWSESTNTGLVSGLFSQELVLLSKTTTSDIVGLRAGDD